MRGLVLSLATVGLMHVPLQARRATQLLIRKLLPKRPTSALLGSSTETVAVITAVEL
jgi:hypothetical protein